MEWYWTLIIIVTSILFLFGTGTPVAFSFGMLNILGLYFFCGMPGLSLVSLGAFSGIANFSLVAVPMFILMGDIITVSGMAERAFSVFDKFLGKVPARMAVLTQLNAMMFGAVSGSSMACTAAIGKIMIPEMLSRGYNKRFCIGSVIGGAALDILIPPSVLAVIYASLADLSVGKLLVAGAVPGVMIGSMFIIYVMVVAMIKPQWAPPYRMEKISFSEKIRSSVHVIPLMVIFVLVMGLIYLGVATASEAASLGAGGAYLLAMGMKKGIKWSSLRECVIGTVKVSGMIFIIIMGSKAFGQLLAYTGVTSELVKTVASLPLSRWWILIGMQTLVVFLGCLMDPTSIMFIIIPIYSPVIKLLNFDPLWFGIIMMINLELGCITPPFGLNLYVAKGVAPKEISMMDIFISVFPFCIMHLLGMIIVMLFPDFFLWLPNKMGN